MKSLIFENCVISSSKTVAVSFYGNPQKEINFSDCYGNEYTGTTIRDGACGYACNTNKLCKITGHKTRTGRLMIDFITFN